MQGWIKLHRQIINSSKFSDPDMLRLWIFCLIKASHKKSVVVMNKKEIELEAGQFITGRFALSQEYNAALSPRKRIKDTTLWGWLNRLKEWGDIDIKTTNKYSVVSIVKWFEYQDCLTTELQQTDNKLTAKPQQTDTNKNDKNDKNDNKKDIGVFEAYTLNSELIETLKSFVEFRKKIKSPMTDHAINLLLSKLDKLSNSESEKIEILNQSIMNGWKSVYAIKNKGGLKVAEFRNRDKERSNEYDALSF